MLRLVFCYILFSIGLLGQSFDPRLPAPVPEVKGPVLASPKVHYIEVRRGSGPLAAAVNQRYSLVYTGWLRDGKQFSAVTDSQHPFQFTPGRRQVIAGFELGFDGMRVGGKRRLFLPYQLAYGVRGNPPAVPARAELIFDIELLAVEDVPAEVPAADLLLTLHDYERKVLDLYKDVPEDKQDWRPAPGMRSFREVFQAIAVSNQRLLGAAMESEPTASLSLAESFSAVRKAMESTRGGLLIHEIQFGGETTTQRGIFIALEAQIAEHLGEARVYALLSGIAK